MGHFELLPDVKTVTEKFVQTGMSLEQAQTSLDAVANFLEEHADYRQSEYEKYGEKTDKGAAESLSESAGAFRSEARYVTAREPYSGE